MSFNSLQEKFWAKTYAEDYIKKNSKFNHELGVKARSKILDKIPGQIDTLLECGCNIGRNIKQIKSILPEVAPSIIEISKPAFDYAVRRYKVVDAFNGAILDSNF